MNHVICLSTISMNTFKPREGWRLDTIQHYYSLPYSTTLYSCYFCDVDFDQLSYTNYWLQRMVVSEMLTFAQGHWITV